ncbi:MAG: hypothetical protein C4B59_03240 [Candidatus Methanogaster sp.]|uniref:Uncharacterized protein n=1 Tax=Candidatus Methanogaster sp. TaxID=3386292 RepID=A0AC61L5I3_9EURY|nr:MAG: hypothetical protein C4B59_03240 [ANME-2 cluster archaeon]
MSIVESSTELAVRFVIELFWIYACIYAVRSTKLIYWKQCWYVVLLGCLIHAAYIVVVLAEIPYADTLSGILRNFGMGIVAVGILMIAKRTKEIMG